MTAPEVSALSAERPFPGLRPFSASDRDFFFGRETQVYALYRLVNLSRFVAVVGSSGSGKSSLVRAGLLPLLEDESRESAGKKWLSLEMRPGDAPLARLEQALVKLAAEVSPGDEPAIAATRKERIAYRLRQSSFGISEALKEIRAAGGASFVLLVDQFEELFRYAGERRGGISDAQARDEAAQFVQLLLEAARSPSHEVHVLLTMRSDFIGDCARFQGLPEAVSAAQFLVPSLTREQREEVIRGPIKKAGASIDPALVERLLNDSGDELDQLPVLQHCLLRLWEHAAPPKEGAPHAGRHISLAQYDEIGGIAGALSQHANAILSNDLPGLEPVVAQVFRALSELDRDGRVTRRALSFARLIAETGLSEADLREVLDRFRADDCSFLGPSPSTTPVLGPDTRIDVSHEALLRRWEKVSGDPGATGERNDRRSVGWLREERRDGQRYQVLLAMAEGDAPGQARLPPDQVERTLAWWNTRPRTEAWAERWGGGFQRVRQLLETSSAARDAELARQKAEEVGRRRAWWTRVAAGILAIAVVGLAGVGYLLNSQAERAQQTSDYAIQSLSDLVRQITSALTRGTVTVASAREILSQSNVEEIVDQISKLNPGPTTVELQANLLLSLSDAMIIVGQTSEALKRAEAARDLVQSPATESPSDLRWQTLLYSAQFRIGDAILRIDQKKPESIQAALAAYHSAQAAAQKIAAGRAASGDAIYNLAFADNKVGEALRLAGDIPGAMEQFNAALGLAQKAAASDPANAGWQAYVPVTMIKIADTFLKQTPPDVNSALGQYAKAVAMQEELAKRFPDNLVVLSNLGSGRRGRGDILVQGGQPGDVDRAIQDFKASVAIGEQLVERDPGNAVWLVSLAPSYSRLGAALLKKGDTNGAIAQYQKELAVRARLAKLDPSNLIWQASLKATVDKLAKLQPAVTPPAETPPAEPAEPPPAETPPVQPPEPDKPADASP